MLGELPKLFGRDFAIGYVLPVAGFVGSSLGLLALFSLTSTVLAFLQADLLVGASVLGLGSLFLAVFLLGMNRSLLMLFEGYGRFNPLRVLLRVKRRRYAQLRKRIAQTDGEYRRLVDQGLAIPPVLDSDRIRLQQEAGESFPDNEAWLLPTALGNTIRAFETYPRVMYGIDTIGAWNRLLAVLPKDYRELIDAAKAQFDFWFNLYVLSLLFIIEYAAAVVFSGIHAVWLPILALVAARLAYTQACRAAVEWGDLVKAAFDVFLPDLASKLKLSIPSKRTEERKLWTRFTQAVLYRAPSAIPERSQLEQDQKNSGRTLLDGVKAMTRFVAKVLGLLT